MHNPALTLTLAIATTAHLIIAAVIALFARHRVKYLSLAWIMGIFAFALMGTTAYSYLHPATLTMLHPATLVMLTAACFLQSIYPLSIPMPAYLQMERMVRYAAPAFALIVAYAVALLLGMRPASIFSLSQVQAGWLSLDILLRMTSVGLSLYYIVNILRLPRRMTRANVPRYLMAYSTMLGLNALFFVVLTFRNFSVAPTMVCLGVFTTLNLYQCLRALESMALEMPKPKQAPVEREPEVEEIREAESDFNEANLVRFERVEHWMQHHSEVWKDNGFGRDVLCRETGLNRHLLLQCVRSQGYYNVHEYINSYRVKEVKRMVLAGQATTLTECLAAGFGAIKTLRTSFQREEVVSIDEFLAEHVPGRK